MAKDSKKPTKKEGYNLRWARIKIKKLNNQIEYLKIYLRQEGIYKPKKLNKLFKYAQIISDLKYSEETKNKKQHQTLQEFLLNKTKEERDIFFKKVEERYSRKKING